jgi:hypothetical protein
VFISEPDETRDDKASSEPVREEKQMGRGNLATHDDGGGGGMKKED